MRISQIVKHIIIINCIIFLEPLFLETNTFFDTIFALYYPMSGSFEYWQIVTHMFMHGNFSHLFFNMFALWMFGTAVEQMYGQKKISIFLL